ncbi:MAG TPA: MFS transporter [Ktedonobacterales bacterium]|nr:MFS transporter [Ktedonobacterales bacterium]
MGAFDSSDSSGPIDTLNREGGSVREPQRPPLTIARHLSLSALWLGVNAISAALLPIVLPIQILLFVAPGAVGDAQQAEYLGWISALGAVVALVVPPLVGALSDRTTLRLGRRRPFILIGVVISVLAAWALARAGDLTTLTAAFLVLQLGFNVTVGAYAGLLPDLTPESQRGAASGYLGLMTILGNVGSLALAGALLANVTITSAATPSGRADIMDRSAIFYTATALVMVAMAIITVVWTRETPVTAADAAQTRPQPRGMSRLERGLQSLRSLWLEPWKSHNFTWVFLTRAFVMLGLTLFLTFIEYYFANVAHVTNFVSATAVVAGLALVGAVLSALTLGILSDRMNRALLVGVSTALMALPAITFVVAPRGIPLWPLGMVFGLGYGAYTSVDWALAVDALPVQANAGKDLGIWSAASTLPAILAPALGGAVIAAVDTFYHQTALGYQAIFALAAICLALGAIFVSFIRNEQAPHATGEREARAHRPGSGWRLAAGSQGGHARGFLRFWPVWERIYNTFLPTSAIPNAPHGVLHVHFGRYRGEPITLPDGTVIQRGDVVTNLHFNNQLLGATSRTVSAFHLVRMIAEDMVALAAWSADDGSPAARSRAVTGLTLIGRAAPRLGFTLRERPVTFKAKLDRFFMEGLMAIYNPAGLGRLERGTTYGSYPVEVWMSRAELLRRYAPGARTSRAGR